MSSHDSTETSFTIAIILIWWCIYLIFLITFSILLFNFWIWYARRKEKRHREVISDPNYQSNQRWKHRTIKTLDLMRNGAYSNFTINYSQIKCIIWLDKFQDSDQIHITNEWTHAFHSKCLQKWYENTELTKNLTCPLWNTENNSTNVWVVPHEANWTERQRTESNDVFNFLLIIMGRPLILILKDIKIIFME